MMKVVAIVARILLGATFIFSGFVKGIDPWGSTYKFIDYFFAFNMSWMEPAAFTLAILQNTAEIVIGVALVFGLRMKETAWGAMLFMAFFTVLTFVIALTNPVTDCGCFGDALILTNWETFYKNIVLMAPTVIIFLYRKKYVPAYRPVGEWSWVALTTIVCVWISIHCYRHLPWFDFRPYRIGADIHQGMIIPDGAPSDVYQSTVIMEKDGEIKEFSANDYPWDDSTWIFLDVKNVLIKKGYEPPIRDFSITTTEGFDITDEVLTDEGFTFLLVAHRLSKANKKALQKANEIARFCYEHGYKFYCLTSSLKSETELFKSELNLEYDFCLTDEITLKTIIRSNPGLVLLQKGTVLGKWHFNNMPDAADLKPNLLSLALEKQANKSSDRLIFGLLLAFIISAFVFYNYRIVK